MVIVLDLIANTIDEFSSRAENTEKYKDTRELELTLEDCHRYSEEKLKKRLDFPSPSWYTTTQAENHKWEL